MIERIVSGGQTGVDRAALDVALEFGMPCGGWCPRDRWAEDGAIDARYPVRESDDADPAVRTRLNVRDSDGTLIVARPPLTGGTALTKKVAGELGRPCLVVEPTDDAFAAIRRWIAEHAIRGLNVAGPRASQWPDGYEEASTILRALLKK